MNSEILYFTNRGVKRRIDELQREMASIFANTGRDSTNDEMRQAYRKEQELMDKIKDFDPNYEKLIRPYGRKNY
jgi:predicted  nucleic acid-binding Zn-ribbon protein